MKKIIIWTVVLAMLVCTVSAFAEATMDELQDFVDNRCTWFSDETKINDEVTVIDATCHNFDNGRDYHFTFVFEVSEANGTWLAQTVISGESGWIGNWYAHNVDQFEEDWISIVNELYEGTL